MRATCKRFSDDGREMPEVRLQTRIRPTEVREESPQFSLCNQTWLTLEGIGHAARSGLSNYRFPSGAFAGAASSACFAGTSVSVVST